MGSSEDTGDEVEVSQAVGGMWRRAGQKSVVGWRAAPKPFDEVATLLTAILESWREVNRVGARAKLPVATGKQL
ncbi:MAG: hypothetical protein H6816_13550 [Phycisphaerales bacterium]|nr:hypothetical protein [Phycisphaerales bacterium]